MITKDKYCLKGKVRFKVLLSSSSNRQILWRQIRKICIMMLRLKGFKGSIHELSIFVLVCVTITYKTELKLSQIL